MGKADRKLKRKHSGATRTKLTNQSVSELQKLPALLKDMIEVNKTLTAENERIHSAVGDILEEHANKIAELRRELTVLKGDQNDEVHTPATRS